MNEMNPMEYPLLDRDEATDKICRQFSERASRYEIGARVQKEASTRLARALDPWRDSLPSGPVLEVGAGTGLYSRHLDRLFPNRNLWITDLAPKMVERVTSQLKTKTGRGDRQFLVHNAERGWFDPAAVEGAEIGTDLPVRPARNESPQMAWDSPGPWSLVTGNFVAQWFRDPSETISRLATGLTPGGLLLMAMPGSDSFPEWKERCDRLGIPYTGNPLPDTERLVIQCTSGPFQADFHEEPLTLTYESSLDFFRELDRVGATTSTTGTRLATADFRRLIREWDRSVGSAPVQLTWHLLFLAIRRDFS